MRRLLYWISLPALLIGLAAALCVFAYWLAFTQDGLRYVVRHLDGNLGSVRVQASGVTGTVAHGAHIDSLILEHRRAHIELSGIDGSLSLPRLWLQTLYSPDIRIHGAVVKVLHYNGPDDHKPPEFLPGVMRAEMINARLDKLRVISVGGDSYDFYNIVGTGTITHDRIRVTHGLATYLGLEFDANGVMRAEEPLGLSGTTEVSWHPPGQPSWSGHGTFDGNLTKLNLGLRIDAPLLADFKGEADDLTDHWNWHGQTDVHRLDLTAWKVGGALGIIHGVLAVHGDHTGFGSHGLLQAPGLTSDDLDTDFFGNYANGVLHILRSSVTHRQSGAVGDATGQILIGGDTTRMDLAGHWRQMQWPLSSKAPDVRSSAGQFTLGGWGHYQYSATGDVLVTGYLPLQVSSRGILHGNGLESTDVTANGYGGSAHMGATVDWSGLTRWQTKGHADHMDLTTVAPEVPGRVGFDFDAHGAGLSAAGEFMVGINNVTGQVRGQRAEGHASVERHGPELAFNDVNLQLGATRIIADGRLGSTSSLNFNIHATDLGLFGMGAHGQLNATGSVHGDLADPTLVLHSSARQINAYGVQADSVDANIDFDPHGDGRSDANVTAHNVTAHGQRMDVISLRSEGPASHHSVQLQARAGDVEFKTSGTGQYLNRMWTGAIDRASLRDAAQLNMQLQAPATVHLSLAQRLFSISDSCLHGDASLLCGSVQWTPQVRRVHLATTDVPLHGLTAGLTHDTDYLGTISATADASDTGDTGWRGVLHGNLASASVVKHLSNGRTESLALGDGTVNFTVTGSGVDGDLQLDAGAAGHLQGAVHGASNDPDADWWDWPLNGHVNLDTKAVGFLYSYVPQADNAAGHLTAAVNVTGTAAAPRVAGDIALRDGRIDSYAVNLSLRQISFDAHLVDDLLSIKGSANIGPEGHASVEGSLKWHDGLPFGQMHLVGSDLRISNIPEIRVDASPDITLNIQGKRIETKGKVLIPNARIEQLSLAGATLTSSDEKMADEPPTKPDDQIKVTGNIRMELGDRVTLSAYGLSGRLTGAIDVALAENGTESGDGTLTIDDGRFLYYGRLLEVRRGELTFRRDALLDDPAIYVRAVKVMPNITVGIDVKGNLRDQRISFFSEPQVSQPQVISMLFAGGSLDTVQSATDAPGARSNAARTESIMQIGAAVGQQVTGRFNIDTNVQQDETNATSLVIGRYLSPRLYVSYGIGLTQAISVVRMRYTLDDHWTIKTEAGTSRSADIVYTTK